MTATPSTSTRAAINVKKIIVPVVIVSSPYCLIIYYLSRFTNKLSPSVRVEKFIPSSYARFEHVGLTEFLLERANFNSSPTFMFFNRAFNSPLLRLLVSILA